MPRRGSRSPGYPTRLCFLYDKAGMVPQLRSEHGFPIDDLRAKRSGATAIDPLWVLRGCLGLWKLMRTARPDVVLTFTPYSNILGCLIGWMAGIPLRIASQRTVPNHNPRLLWWAEGWLARRGVIQQVIAVSEAVRRFCVVEQGIPSERVQVIPNGVELDRFATVREQRAAKRAGLGLEGEMADPRPYLAAADVFALASSREGLPNASRRVAERFSAETSFRSFRTALEGASSGQPAREFAPERTSS